MSIKEFDTEDELDDAFEELMEWEEIKGSLEYAVENCGERVEGLRAELRSAQDALEEAENELESAIDELKEAEKELEEHLDNKPE